MGSTLKRNVMKTRLAHSPARTCVCLTALPPTRWTVVERARDRSRDAWARDLEILASLYRPVLIRHLILRMRIPPDRAEDLVQTFLVEKLLEQNVLHHATPQKGRLRSFLLKVFSNFVASQLREQRALKRRPSDPEAERLDDLPELPSGDASLSDNFDMLWARQVLARALDRLCEECQAKGRMDLWRILEARTVSPVLDGVAPLPYEELVARFGLRSPSEASNLLITAKRMFSRTLREVVRETVSDDREVEAEILELRRILSR